MSCDPSLERWQLPHRDVAYLAENGLLRLSVRLFGVEMEFGTYEEGAEADFTDRCASTTIASYGANISPKSLDAAR